MRIVWAGLATLMMASPLAAQTQPDNAAAAAAKEEPKICKRMEQTGSRTASKRVCHTASEWRAIDSDAERSAGGSNFRGSKPN